MRVLSGGTRTRTFTLCSLFHSVFREPPSSLEPDSQCDEALFGAAINGRRKILARCRRSSYFVPPVCRFLDSPAVGGRQSVEMVGGSAGISRGLVGVESPNCVLDSTGSDMNRRIEERQTPERHAHRVRAGPHTRPAPMPHHASGAKASRAAERQRGREAERQRGREAERQRGREAERQRGGARRAGREASKKPCSRNKGYWM